MASNYFAHIYYLYIENNKIKIAIIVVSVQLILYMKYM